MKASLLKQNSYYNKPYVISSKFKLGGVAREWLFYKSKERMMLQVC